jgi:hypothetical protein
VRSEVNAVMQVNLHRHAFKCAGICNSTVCIAAITIPLCRATLSRNVCYPEGCAATRESASPVQHMKAPEQAQKDTSP